MGSCANNIPYSYLIIEESGSTVYIVVEDWANYFSTFRKTVEEKTAPLLNHYYTSFNKYPGKSNGKRNCEFDHGYTSQTEISRVSKKSGKFKRKLTSEISTKTENKKKKKYPCDNLSQECCKTAYKCRSCGEVYLGKTKFQDHCATKYCSNISKTNGSRTISNVADINFHNLHEKEKLNNISNLVSDLPNDSDREAGTSQFPAEDISIRQVTKLAFKCQICSDVYIGETNFETHRIGCRKAAPKSGTVKRPEIPPKPIKNVEFVVVGNTQKDYTVPLLPDQSNDLLHIDTGIVKVEYNNDACDVETYVNTACDVSTYDDNTRNVGTSPKSIENVEFIVMGDTQKDYTVSLLPEKSKDLLRVETLNVKVEYHNDACDEETNVNTTPCDDNTYDNNSRNVVMSPKHIENIEYTVVGDNQKYYTISLLPDESKDLLHVDARGLKVEYHNDTNDMETNVNATCDVSTYDYNTRNVGTSLKCIENIEFIVVEDTQKDYTVSLLPDQSKDLLHVDTRSIKVEYHNDARGVETYLNTTCDGETHNTTCDVSTFDNNRRYVKMSPKPIENIEFIVVGDPQKDNTVSLLPDRSKDALHVNTRNVKVEYHNDTCDSETHDNTTCEISTFDNNPRYVKKSPKPIENVEFIVVGDPQKDNAVSLLPDKSKDALHVNTRNVKVEYHNDAYGVETCVSTTYDSDRHDNKCDKSMYDDSNTCDKSTYDDSNTCDIDKCDNTCDLDTYDNYTCENDDDNRSRPNANLQSIRKISKTKIAEKSISHTFADTRGASKGTKPQKATKVVYTCKVCYRIFVGSNVFKMHSLRCKEGNVDTDKCDKIINTKITEESISQTFADTCGAGKGTEPKNDTKAVFTCNICHRIIVSSYFKKHSLRCKEGNVDTDKCCDCGTIFELDVKKKRNRQTRGSGSRCPKCYSLYRQRTRREHTRRRHMVRPYPCDICGKSFAERTRLKIHSLTHTDLRPFKCECCDYSARTKSVLKTHLERVHPEGREGHPKPRYIRRRLHKEGLSETDVAMRLATDEEVHRCKQCRAIFAQETELEIHSNRHKNLELNGDSKYFLCDRCPKVFNQKCNFTMHYRLHTNERPYKCELCDKTFTGKMYLNSHKHTHTGEKRFKCQECNSAFLTKIALKYHFRKHSGEKRFQCTVCMSHFREAAGLVKHQSTVHDAGSEERTFKCYICGGGFLRKRNLVLHLRVHKNITIDNQNTTIENW